MVVIVIVVLVVIIWLGYEILVAPMTPDTYNVEEEDVELENKDKR